MSKDIKKPVGETRRYVGIDLGDKKSRVCILDERAEIALQEWVVTTPEAFFKRFHGETKMDMAMEVGAHSRWASDLLGRCGHKVVVAGPRQPDRLAQDRPARSGDVPPKPCQRLTTSPSQPPCQTSRQDPRRHHETQPPSKNR